MVMVVLATATGCGDEPKLTAAACRQAFADHAQLLGENGNPGTDATPRLTGRWDAMDAELGRLAESATSDECPATLERYKLESKRLEEVLFAVRPFDVTQDLVVAEGGLEHARKMRAGFEPDQELRRAFASLRASVPAARRALAPHLAKVDAVDPLDPAAVASAVDALTSRAEADPDYRKVKALLAEIADYELDEE